MWCEAHLTNWLHTRKNTTVRYTITKGVLNENVDLAWNVWKSYIKWNEKNSNRHNKLNKNGIYTKLDYHSSTNYVSCLQLSEFIFIYFVSHKGKVSFC